MLFQQSLLKNGCTGMTTTLIYGDRSLFVFIGDHLCDFDFITKAQLVERHISNLLQSSRQIVHFVSEIINMGDAPFTCCQKQEDFVYIAGILRH